LSGRGLCDELITRPEESYRLCCVVVCDLETSRMGAPYIYDISRLRVNVTIILAPKAFIASNNRTLRMFIFALYLFLSFSTFHQFRPMTDVYSGPGSSVSIATGYGLNGPGIESR